MECQIIQEYPSPLPPLPALLTALRYLYTPGLRARSCENDVHILVFKETKQGRYWPTLVARLHNLACGTQSRAFIIAFTVTQSTSLKLRASSLRSAQIGGGPMTKNKTTEFNVSSIPLFSRFDFSVVINSPG